MNAENLARGIAEIGDETFEVGPGDAMLFTAPSVGHHLRNPFEVDLVGASPTGPPSLRSPSGRVPSPLPFGMETSSGRSHVSEPTDGRQSRAGSRPPRSGG